MHVCVCVCVCLQNGRQLLRFPQKAGHPVSCYIRNPTANPSANVVDRHLVTDSGGQLPSSGPAAAH